MPKTCQNCHDLKSLRRELRLSYDQYRSLAEHRSSMEDGYLQQIDELNKQIEYLEEQAKKQSDAVYRLTCQNESLSNQLASNPGLATVNRYKEDITEHAKERTKAWQLAALSSQKLAEVEKKVKELEKEIERLSNCPYCLDSKIKPCDCCDQ